MTAIGLDVVSVSRVSAALERWPQLAGRLFTESEQASARRNARPGQHLAGKFAAKEAVFKALGDGWPRVSWTDVEISSDDGPPLAHLHGRAKQLAGTSKTSVTISHDGDIAVAAALIHG